MQIIGYSTVSSVLEAWDAARRTSKNFESEFGKLLIDRYVNTERVWIALESNTNKVNGKTF